MKSEKPRLMDQFRLVPIDSVCSSETSGISLKDLPEQEGDYPIYGASGFVRKIDSFQQDREYIGVVKDGSGIGRVGKYPPFSSLLGTMLYLLPNDDIDIDYLRLALQNMNLSKYGHGAAIPHIYFRDFKNGTIRLRSMNDQKYIAKEIMAIESLIEKNKLQLRQIDELVKSREVGINRIG